MIEDFLKKKPELRLLATVGVLCASAGIFGYSAGNHFDSRWEGFGIALGLTAFLVALRIMLVATSGADNGNVVADPDVQAQKAVERYAGKWAKFLGFAGLVPLLGTVFGLLVFLPGSIKQAAIDESLKRTEADSTTFKELFKNLQEEVVRSATSAIREIAERGKESERQIDTLKKKGDEFDKTVANASAELNAIQEKQRKAVEENAKTAIKGIEVVAAQGEKQLEKINDLQRLTEEYLAQLKTATKDVKNATVLELGEIVTKLKELPENTQSIAEDFGQFKKRLVVLEGQLPNKLDVAGARVGFTFVRSSIQNQPPKEGEKPPAVIVSTINVSKPKSIPIPGLPPGARAVAVWFTPYDHLEELAKAVNYLDVYLDATNDKNGKTFSYDIRATDQQVKVARSAEVRINFLYQY